MRQNTRDCVPAPVAGEGEPMMKCVTRTITVRTTRGPQFVDITDQVAAAARDASLRDGFAIVFSRHTTAAIRINENEPMLIRDMEQFLEKVAPAQAYSNHTDCSNG